MNLRALRGGDTKMKTTKLFPLLIVILLSFMTVALFISSRKIIAQNNEINNMQERIENLETIVTYDYLYPAGYDIPNDIPNDAI